jgi:large subunit ribosomal protein L9
VAKQEVLLVKDVLKLGNMGDIVKVQPGYARNYLFTHALAIPASAAAKRQIEVLREKAAKSEAEREVKSLSLAKSMQGTTIQIAARVAHETELFGAIGTKEIVQALAKSGIEVDGKQIQLADRIRRLGVYQIEVKLHKKVSVTVKLEVVNSDPNAPSLAETLAALEAARKAKAEGKTEAAEAPAADEAKADKKSEKPAKAAKGDDAKGDKADKGGKGEKSKGDKPAKKQKG